MKLDLKESDRDFVDFSFPYIRSILKLVEADSIFADKMRIHVVT